MKCLFLTCVVILLFGLFAKLNFARANEEDASSLEDQLKSVEAQLRKLEKEDPKSRLVDLEHQLYLLERELSSAPADQKQKVQEKIKATRSQLESIRPAVVELEVLKGQKSNI
ncbi:hypothetical protein L0152_31920, partial [bacterium]|nr:hypothetical protein [bacterium]